MNDGYHAVIVGVLYIIAAFLFLSRNRSNVFDKGYAWFLFSVFHGIDEIADGLVQAGQFPGYTTVLESVEYVTFFLSSSFLLIATLVKINWIRASEIFKIGFVVQAPVIAFFLFSGEPLIHALESLSFTVGSLEVLYFTLLFGILPTLSLAVVYGIEFFDRMQRTSALAVKKRIPVGLLLVALMLFLYNFAELLATFSPWFLYLEVIAVAIILLVPLELHLGSDRRIQLFLVYHRDGFPVIQTKFNTNITEDTLVLVTGFLSAINTMVKEELDLGELEKLETGNGIMYLVHKTPFIYALLVQQEDPNLTQRLYDAADSIHVQLEEARIDPGMAMATSVRQNIDQEIMRQFS